MVCTDRRKRSSDLSPIIGAITLCVLVSIFIALPSTWSDAAIRRDDVAITSSSGDVLRAPLVLAPTQWCAGAAVPTMIVAVLVWALAATKVARKRRHDANESSQHLALKRSVQRRGPPRAQLCHAFELPDRLATA